MKFEIWNMKYEMWNMKYEIWNDTLYICAVLHQMTSINPDFATFNKLKQDYTSAFREKQGLA